jgi:hypothetical protein
VINHYPRVLNRTVRDSSGGEFLHLSGDKTRDIKLFENDFSKAKQAIVKDGDVEITL